jgi:transglutaminase-like putative cysteine protease
VKINEFLCEHMTYDKSKSFVGNDFWTNQSYGVCEQYAGLFRYMCWRADLLCFTVSGTVTGGGIVNSGNGHTWDYVYVDGVWQYYDGTFSDTASGSMQYGTPANKFTYTPGSPTLIPWFKEIFVPGSSL